MGGLQAALDAAASLAEVEDFDTLYIGTPISPEQRIFEKLGRELGQISLPRGSVLGRLSQQLAPYLRLSDSLQDPANLYLRCLACGGF